MDVAANPQFPRQQGTPVSEIPLQSQGPNPFYPAMCIGSHWDAGAILRRTLPEQYVPQALDPRPWVKVCLEYGTSGDNGPAPSVGTDTVLPGGGQFYPASRYAAAIDNESQLRRLDRPLGTCDADQYEPDTAGDMFDNRVLVPGGAARAVLVPELEVPKALRTAGPYKCRYENDLTNIALAGSLFMNATKQDRYKLMPTINREIEVSKSGAMRPAAPV